MGDNVRLIYRYVNIPTVSKALIKLVLVYYLVLINL